MDHSHATHVGHIVVPRTPESFTTLRIGALRHTFHEHPLMQLPALEKLAHELSATRQCRFLAPGTTQDSRFAHGPAHPEGREISEVFRRIDEPGTWLALYNIETHPTYRGFLAEVIDCMRPIVEREQGKIFKETGFIFISAPPSLTPFHIDRENNFWLQIRGRKHLNVWDNTDRATVPARAVDAFIVMGTPARAELTPELVGRSHAYDVGPGDGVFFPSTSPHMTRTEDSWVRPGDGVSVSIGVNFYTERTRRSAYAHAANLLMRQVGLGARHPGESRALDTMKRPLGEALLLALKLVRGHKNRPGF